MSLDINPHAWVNVQNSSVRPERPPLRLPVGGERVRPLTLVKCPINTKYKIQFLSPWVSDCTVQWSHLHSFNRSPSHQYVLVIRLYIQLWLSVVQLQIIDDHKSAFQQSTTLK